MIAHLATCTENVRPTIALPKASSLNGIPGTEESIQCRLIAQDPDGKTSRPSHHATGEQDEVMHEPPKLHPNVRVSILLQVQHHGEPRFDVPGQRGHDHVGPVADQIVDWHAHGIDAVLELLNDIFLITPLIGTRHDFSRAQVCARGDVEEIPNLIEQDILPFHLADVLA